MTDCVPEKPDFFFSVAAFADSESGFFWDEGDSSGFAPKKYCDPPTHR
jgi:hypothetical protein